MLKNSQGLGSILSFQVELAGLTNELRHVRGLLRIENGTPPLIHEDPLQILGGESPILAFHIHSRGMPREIRLGVTLSGLTK